MELQMYFHPVCHQELIPKFFDNFIIPNYWYRYDNSRLNETISRFVKFPIATSIDKKEPRLLAISA